jgi:hypothetical protein
MPAAGHKSRHEVQRARFDEIGGVKRWLDNGDGDSITALSQRGPSWISLSLSSLLPLPTFIVEIHLLSCLQMEVSIISYGVSRVQGPSPRGIIQRFLPINHANGGVVLTPSAFTATPILPLRFCSVLFSTAMMVRQVGL